MIKKCPRCGANHKKKGTYCSRSCANVRTHTQADKDIRRKKLLDYAVEIPTVMGEIEDYEMFDNFERIEKW